MQPANLGEQIHPNDALEGQTYYHFMDGMYKKVKIKEIARHDLNNQMPTGSPFGLLVVNYLPENTNSFIAFQRYGNLHQPTKMYMIKQTGGKRKRNTIRSSKRRSKQRRR